MSPRGVKPNLQPDTQQRLHRQLPPPRLAGSRQTAANSAVARSRTLTGTRTRTKTATIGRRVLASAPVATWTWRWTGAGDNSDQRPDDGNP